MTSSIFIDFSESKIIPDNISLNVCCNPSPTPTSKAAEPAINTVNLTPKVSKIKAIAITQTIYLIICSNA